MTDSRPNSKNPTHSLSRPATELLNTLQKVLPDGEPIFTKVQQGTKKGVKGYLEPQRLLTAAEAQQRVQDGDNYGFRLGYETNEGWMLAVLDVEEQGVLPDDVAEWTDERALVRWWSLHVGLNRLLMVTPDAYDLLSDASEVDLDGDGDHEVELLAPTRAHALAPGSTVEHRHCSDSKPCDGTGTGNYRLDDVNPDAPVVGMDAVEDLLEMLDLDPESTEGSDTSTVSAEPSKTNDDTEWSSLDESTRSRIERAKGFEWGDEFTALIEGRYADVGFPDDRSEAEYRLVYLLGWLFGDDKTVVRRAMTAICRLNPQTDVREREPRKWLERPDDSYRDDTLDKACQHDSTYNPPTARPYENRPDVAAGTKSGVFEAILDLGIANSQEIADHEAVDRSRRQVQRALNEQETDIQSKDVGRRRVYYIDTAFVPVDKQDEYDL